MAQNFLYMFEFVVDDLLITRPNKCAPEVYPTCVEITFRSSVYVAICDHEYGKCVDMCAPKCGKCCLFSLESPVTEKDRIMIHVYKKKDENCKFLLGVTDMLIKPLFDKVTDDFDIENPKWMDRITRHNACLPDPKQVVKRGEAPPKMPDFCDNCYDEIDGRKEQFCPTSEMSKALLPLFSMKGVQTGNLMLITRLVCNGPAIVSTFQFSKFCTAGCDSCPKKKQKTICPSPCPCPCPPKDDDGCDNDDSKPDCKACRMPDPCKKPDPKPPACLRYFACNADRGCPCDECTDYNDRECGIGCKPVKPCKPKRKSKSCCPQPRQCGGGKCSKANDSDDCCNVTQDKGYVTSCEDCMEECEAVRCCDDEEENSSSEDCMQPCFMEPLHRVYGPDAYEEFEACLNGSGITIRVLKATHNLVSSSCDSIGINSNLTTQPCRNGDKTYETIEEYLKDQKLNTNCLPGNVGRRPATHSASVPNVRANIKYAGENSPFVESYRVPFSKIKNICTVSKVDQYRKPGTDDCNKGTELRHTRSCCLQVDPIEIKSLLKNINADANKKGIEVCYKNCDDAECDVFVVKLGSKNACERKRRSVEVELKTPKMPIICPIAKYTTETQTVQEELDKTAEVSKGGKKGKKK